MSSPSSSKKVVVVHDVLGTLFGLERPIDELQSVLGEQVRDRRFAELIVMDWYHAAQRDFLMLSVGQAYTPIGVIFQATLPRVLRQAGLHVGGVALATVVKRMMATLKTLTPRPGMQAAFSHTYPLDGRAAGLEIDVWGATNGGLELAETLFKGALGQEARIVTGKDAAQQLRVSRSHDSQDVSVGLFSCDEIEVAKSDPRVYAEVKQRVSSGSASATEEDSGASLWFVASHTWDLFAARKAGFKTAWVSYEEFDPAQDIYGEHDVVAKDLNDVAKQIIEQEKATQ